jgi:hypothetical protein
MPLRKKPHYTPAKKRDRENARLFISRNSGFKN